MSELSPCKHCGASTAQFEPIFPPDPAGEVCCGACQIYAYGETREAAVAAWNRRPATDVDEETEPVSAFFGLSYSNYFVMQRLVLESMPVEWQRRFVKLVEEIGETLDMTDVPDAFTVHRRDERGRFLEDPYSRYRHAPRVPRKDGAT